MAITKTQLQLANERIFEWLQDRNYEKNAADAIGDFTRTTMREEGIARRLQPPKPVSDDELSRQVWTDKPVIVVDKEPSLPPAIAVPYGSLPIAWYIRAPRYAITFQRILSPRFTKDISELRTWNMDIRQVVADDTMKDMLAQEDSEFLSAVNSALFAQGVASPVSGAVQWQQLVGGITRDSLADGFKIMPSTKFHLEAAQVLMNNVTVWELPKFDRIEKGGDSAEKVFRDGWTDDKIYGKDLYVTIKRDLVPDNTVYHFANEKFIGKTYERIPPTMWIKREHFFLEYFIYEEIGGAIGHTGGLSRADYV